MGPHFLKDVLTIFLRKSGADAVNALERFLCEVGFTLGTACSGTDSPVFVVAALKEIFSKGGQQVNIRHVFSCELDSEKQKWIQEACPELETLFADIRQLRDRNARNVISGKFEAVPKVFLFVAGFSCKDLSALNPNQSSHIHYIGNGEGSTGATFDGVIGYLILHQPNLVILENVCGIATLAKGKVLAEVLHLLDRAGYIVVHRRLNAKDFFVPQCRWRIWFVCVSKTFVAESNFSPDFVKIYLNQMMDLIGSNNQPLHMDDVLLSEADPAVQRHLGVCENFRHRKTSAIEWMEQRISSVGESWFDSEFDIVDPETAALYPEYKTLTYRQLDLLRYSNVSLPSYPCQILDINNSATFGGATTIGYIGACTPKGQFFMSDRVRTCVVDGIGGMHDEYQNIDMILIGRE